MAAWPPRFARAGTAGSSPRADAGVFYVSYLRGRGKEDSSFGVWLFFFGAGALQHETLSDVSTIKLAALGRRGEKKQRELVCE